MSPHFNDTTPRIDNPAVLPPALYQDFTCPTPSRSSKLALHAQLLDTHGMIELLKSPYIAPLPPKQCSWP